MSLPSRTPAGSLRPSDVGRTVRLQGWVNRRRDHGELVFIDLRDRSGLAQVVFDAELLPDAALLTLAKELRNEFVVDVTGAVVARGADAVNAELPTGAIEIGATSLAILNRADTPPFPIEDGIKAAEDLRLKYRYLDLRRPEMTKRFVVRSSVTMAIREVLHEEGFLDVETPILTKSTPEGARDFLVPSRIHPGEFYALPQSPQLFKQLLMVSGMERYYQIARCFRDEDLRADRQLEFTQVDIEMSFPTEETVFALVEKLFTRVFPKWGIACDAPFKRMTYEEAMERFGIDRPDTQVRAGAGKFRSETSKRRFLRRLKDVKGLCVPGGASFSRKRLDDIEKGARAAGVEWFFWVKTAEPRQLEFQLEEVLRRRRGGAAARRARRRRTGDLVFHRRRQSQGRLRLPRRAPPPDRPRGEAGSRRARYDFLWVTDFPLVEWHEEDARWYATHHPFTSPREEDLALLESDPGRVKARAYDVVLNGMELGGGSIRIHRPDVQSRVFARLGIGPEEAPREVRIPPRRVPLRRAAARRDRARPRPPAHDPHRLDVDPRRHRVPEDGLRHRPHDGVPEPRRARAARRAPHRAREAAEGVKSFSFVAAGARTDVVVGEGALASLAARLPSIAPGRWFLVSSKKVFLLHGACAVSWRR